MSPAELLMTQIKAAIAAAIANGELIGEVPNEIRLERPKNRDHGDFATSVALQLAKAAGAPPRKIAEVLAAKLTALPEIAKVDIAGPGFINFTLNRAAQAELISRILSAGKNYGTGDSLNGVAINLEFISANPTGPLHLGHTRWAAVGDALGRVLTAAGANVTREFYINDRGVQMDLFGKSVQAAAKGNPIPEDGYQGEYISDLAKAIVTTNESILELPEPDQFIEFRERAYELQLAEQQKVLKTFNTNFDVWFSERSLHDDGAVAHGLNRLKNQGHVFESDGATWLKTTDFGDDKDRVLIKNDASLTYFASDTAYYINKRERGFDICIYMLGADHHGYIGRLKATAACAGDDPNYNIEILIGQLVKIMRGQEEVKLSKRAGTIITLEDIVDEVGVDAARYTLIRYPVDTPMTMDLALLKENTNDNPVYYVQYAHARIANLIRNANELGIKVGEFDTSQISHDRENELLGALDEYPRIVAFAAELREPHRVARFLEEIAGIYHRFYSDCRVLPIGDEQISPIHIARVNLCAATRQVLENGLSLLGVSAPERM